MFPLHLNEMFLKLAKFSFKLCYCGWLGYPALHQLIIQVINANSINLSNHLNLFVCSRISTHMLCSSTCLKRSILKYKRLARQGTDPGRTPCPPVIVSKTWNLHLSNNCKKRFHNEKMSINAKSLCSRGNTLLMS